MSQNSGKGILSVVTPAFNEEKNIPILYQKLHEVFQSMQMDWEWIVVDDHSSDLTFQVLTELSRQKSNVKAIRFSKNFGSHTAIMCGLHHAVGSCAVALAADLEDSPLVIRALVDDWKKGNQVVWAVRKARPGVKLLNLGFSRLFYFIMRRIAGMQSIPSTGADFYLIDRRVIDALKNFREKNLSHFALITWMGFRQSYVHYDKGERQYGKSGWTLEKKIKILIDSVTSFTYLPLRFMSYIGFGVANLGFLYAIVVFINAIHGHPPQGWTSLTIIVLVIGGIQMLMMGLLGEYLWRALDESRRRPQYLIEDQTLNISTNG